MKKFLLVLALACAPALAPAQPVLLHTVSAAAIYAPCCDASEVATIRDLNYVARKALGHAGPIVDRLYAMNAAISAADYTGWNDPDRGLLLGYMAATPDGKYWRPLLDRFAAKLGVTVKAVTLTTPSPVVVVPPAPPPVIVQPPTASAGSIDSLVRLIVRQELAKLPTGQPGTTVANVVQGDLIVNGKVCVGGPCLGAKPGEKPADAVLQLRGYGSAEISFSSNEGGTSPQWGVRRGVSVLSGSGDLGLRLIHNAYWGPEGMTWGDPIRPISIFAFDSQGTLSLSQDMPGTTQGSAKAQHWVFRADYNRKIMAFTSMLPGWRMCVGWSTNTNDFQNLWCPEGGNR